MNYSNNLPFYELSNIEITELYSDHPLGSEFYENKIFTFDYHSSYITGRDSNNLAEFVDCKYMDVESFNSLIEQESQNSLSFLYMNIRSIPARLTQNQMAIGCFLDPVLVSKDLLSVRKSISIN